MKKIIEAKDLPEGEKVYLRKDSLGWRMVKPIKNEDGSMNWPNLLFGGWRNLIMLLFILAVVLWHLHEDKLNLEAVKNNCMGIALGEGLLDKSVLNSTCACSYPRLNVSTLTGYGGVLINADG